MAYKIISYFALTSCSLLFGMNHEVFNREQSDIATIFETRSADAIIKILSKKELALKTSSAHKITQLKEINHLYKFILNPIGNFLYKKEFTKRLHTLQNQQAKVQIQLNKYTTVTPKHRSKQKTKENNNEEKAIVILSKMAFYGRSKHIAKKQHRYPTRLSEKKNCKDFTQFIRNLQQIADATVIQRIRDSKKIK